MYLKVISITLVTKWIVVKLINTYCSTSSITTITNLISLNVFDWIYLVVITRLLTLVDLYLIVISSMNR